MTAQYAFQKLIHKYSSSKAALRREFQAEIVEETHREAHRDPKRSPSACSRRNHGPLFVGARIFLRLLSVTSVPLRWNPSWVVAADRAVKRGIGPGNRRPLHSEIERAEFHITQLALFCLCCVEERRGLAGAIGKRMKAKRPSDGRGYHASELAVSNHFGRPFLE